MGQNETKIESNQIETFNFGEKEIVNFEMNVFIITELNLKKFLKNIIGMELENEQNININRNLPLNHKNYKGWNFTYLEKNENEKY